MPRFVEGCDNPPADGTVDASITRYLGMLDTADRQEDRVAELRIGRLTEHLEALRRQMRQLQVMERVVADAPDHQVSLTDPDARAMATNGKGTGMVGYNVQTVVDAKHHLIVAHEVTNIGHDKHQLASMARQANEVIGADGLTVLADRGYFSGEEVVACEALRREGGRALREAGLHLSARNRHLPLPGGRAADLALHHCRARADAQPVLVQQLRHLRDEGHVRGKGAAWDAAQRGRPWACVRTFDLSSAALRASSQR